MTDSEVFNVTSLSEQFEGQGVLATLELTQKTSIYNSSYQVTVVPQLSLVFLEKNIFQLRVSYDIPYNVTVELSLCRQTVTDTTSIVLYYSESWY